uniref:C2H2-type domain-containing protein n=1 Tax=Heterorhabditis bacteriophora TaxID=37862 RepID=A0A1I7XGA5_HETBA
MSGFSLYFLTYRWIYQVISTEHLLSPTPNSKSPHLRGRGRPRKYPAVSAEPPTIKKRVAATIKVEENLKKTKQEVEAPSSPRQSRMRQPSRKLLESRQDLMASVFPHKRKHRSSISSSRTVSQSRGDDSEVIIYSGKKEDLIVDETDARRSNLIEESPIMSHTVPEVTTSSKSASRRRKVTINEPHVDVHMPSLAPCSPSPRNFVPSQSSIAIRDGSDLPEEHRPKERARPVGPHLIGLRSVQQEQHPAKRYLTPRPTPDIPQNAHFLPSGSRVPSPAEEHVIEEIVQDDMPQLDEKISGPSTYTVIDENGEEIVYEVGEGEMIEEVEYSEVPEGMEIVEAREVRNADGSTTIIHSVAPKSDIQQQDDKGSLKPVKQEPTHNEEEQNLVVDEDAPPTLQPEVGPTQEELITGPQLSGDDLRTVEFNFLDNKNICCGLCGEIVPYENLMTEHLPNNHPEVLGDGTMDLEEIPYEVWLRDKLYNEKKSMENGFRTFDGSHQYGMTRSTRMLRKVSQIRVNPIEMSLSQLEAALKKKMVEKMGRKVPVSLVDKQHARCGICNAVVSLNKKFEIVHLVRHFNAWHPSAHRCAGTWATRPSQPGAGKPLSIQDFAVIDVSIEASDNLQCIWCGMFMDRNALAMHFTEVHPEEIEVPKCLLCMQEIVINARLMEKYGEDFEVLLPDEFHVKCQKFEQTYSSESALDKAIERRVRKMQTVSSDQIPMLEEDDEEDEPPSNTKDSYVESISECQWRCKLCNGNIFGAVISAGAIKHYKNHHPAEMENMQYELCKKLVSTSYGKYFIKARLERISDGCMEFVHPQLVECLICNLTYALHKPYNMCRGIRHLKAKHPEMMPEYTGTPATSGHARRPFGTQGLRMGETIQDPEMIARFRNEYNVDFDKARLRL